MKLWLGDLWFFWSSRTVQKTVRGNCQEKQSYQSWCVLFCPKLAIKKHHMCQLYFAPTGGGPWHLWKVITSQKPPKCSGILRNIAFSAQVSKLLFWNFGWTTSDFFGFLVLRKKQIAVPVRKRAYSSSFIGMYNNISCSTPYDFGAFFLHCPSVVHNQKVAFPLAILVQERICLSIFFNADHLCFRILSRQCHKLCAETAQCDRNHSKLSTIF